MDGLKRQGELVDTSTHAKELAISSLAHRDSILDIIQSFGCLSFDVSLPQNQAEKSIVEKYKDFNGLFEDHFYKKASIGASKIKQEKVSAIEKYQRSLLQLPVAKSVFNIDNATDMDESFEYTSRKLLNQAVESLKSKLKWPSAN